MSATHASLDYAQVAAKLSATLGRKWGVRILFGGHPSTDGETIVLPHWPMTDPRMRGALYGLIAHEAGGHVRRTDFDALRAHSAALSWPLPIWKSFENILEDIRIEANLLRDYPGMRLYLDMAVQVMLETEADPANVQTVDYWPTVFNWCLLVFRHDILGQRDLGPKRDAVDVLAGRLVDRSVLDQAYAIGRAAGDLGGERAQFADLLDLADRLTDLFMTADVPDTIPPDTDPSSADAGEETSPGEGKPSDPDGSGEGEDNPPAAASGGGSDPSAPPEASDQDGAGAPENSDGECASEAQDAGAEAAETGSPVPVDKSVPAVSRGDLFEEICEAVQDAPIVYDGPVVGASDIPSGPPIARDVTDIYRRSAAMSQRLIPVLAPMIVGESWDETRSRTGRKFSADRLARIGLDPDPSVFRKRVVEDDQSVAFHVLVDRSGSTSSCIDRIRGATLALVSALEAFPQVATAISHFPVREKGRHDTATYLTKPFLTPLRQSLGTWPDAEGGTPLSWALLEAAFSFALVTQTRRIVVVVTDGKPSDADAVREARKTCRLLGVEVIGLVVGCESYPADLFEDSAAIEDVAELAPALNALVLRNI